MTACCEWNIKYGADQTGDSLRFVWRLQSCLPMNFIAIKSKLYIFLLLHGLTLNLHDDTYICFIVRNLNSWTTMLEDHASQWIYNSRITAVFREFSRFTLCLPVNSRITRNPSQTLLGENWCWLLITLLTILNDSIWTNDYIRSYSTVLPYFSTRILDKQKGTSRLSMIVRVNIVLNRTVDDSDWHFDNLCGSHLQSQSELYHVSWLNSG